MTSIKSKMPLVALIILICLALFFTLWDIIYEKQLLQLLDFIFKRQMLQKILILYSILTIFAIVLIYSRTAKKSEAVSRSGRKFEKLLESKSRHLKCPNCNEIFTIKKSKGNDNRSFVITCPCCRTTGWIPSKAKSVETNSSV